MNEHDEEGEYDIRDMRGWWENGVADIVCDNQKRDCIVLTYEGSLAFRGIPPILDMLEILAPGSTDYHANVEPSGEPVQRITYLEEWASNLEREATLEDSRGMKAAAYGLRRNAKALRDTVALVRKLATEDHSVG